MLMRRWVATNCGGKVTDRQSQTQLPSDYTDLEKRVDALRTVHQKLLEVTYVLTKLLDTFHLFPLVNNTATKPTTIHPTSANLLVT